jgi:hypothetical protein
MKRLAFASASLLVGLASGSARADVPPEATPVVQAAETPKSAADLAASPAPTPAVTTAPPVAAPPPPAPVVTPLPIAPSAAPAPPARQRAVIRFAPDSPDLSLLVLAGSRPGVKGYQFRNTDFYVEDDAVPVYGTLCDGACDSPVKAGSYDLALSHVGKAPVPVGSVDVSGPVLVHATYVDHSTRRIVGAAVVVAGIVGGVTLGVLAARGEDQLEEPSMNDSLLAAGIATAVVGAVVGTILGLKKDEAHLEVTPLPSPAPTPAATPVPRPAGMQSKGAGLSLRF